MRKKNTLWHVVNKIKSCKTFYLQVADILMEQRQKEKKQNVKQVASVL